MANCTPWNAIFPKAGCYPNSIKSGVSPQMSAPSNTDSNRELNRMILRNVWNTAPQGTLANKTGAGYRGRWANSSFRIVNNAGDVLSRQNYSCGGSDMVGSRPGMLNLTYGGGQSKAKCDGSGIAPSTCNVKYVYDSSDFIRYRKLKALNASYVSPDYSDGGGTKTGKNKVKKYSYENALGLGLATPVPADRFLIASFNTLPGEQFALFSWNEGIQTYKDLYVKIFDTGFSSLSAAQDIAALKGGLTNGFVVPGVTYAAAVARAVRGVPDPVTETNAAIFISAAEIAPLATIGGYSFEYIIQKIISNEKGLINDSAQLVIPFKRQSGCTLIDGGDDVFPEFKPAGWNAGQKTREQTKNMPGSWHFIVTGILSANPQVNWWMSPSIGLHWGMPLKGLVKTNVGLIEMYNSDGGAAFLNTTDPITKPYSPAGREPRINRLDRFSERDVAGVGIGGCGSWCPSGANVYVLAQHK